jgi:hypothetical protein
MEEIKIPILDGAQAFALAVAMRSQLVTGILKLPGPVFIRMHTGPTNIIGISTSMASMLPPDMTLSLADALG